MAEDPQRNRLDATPNGTANYFSSGLQKDIDYGYDDLHRLTSATYNTDTQSEAFDYDVLGNRETWTKRSTAVANYTSNEANEYESIESTDLDYDAAGNLISSAAGYGYAYDYDNRLTLIFLDSNGDGVQDLPGELTLATYQYDALGRRIEYVDHITGASPVTTRYYHDGDNVAAEYDAATTPVLQRYYVHGTQYIDEWVLVHDATAVNPVNRERYYYLRDLYTVDGLVNNRGHELERYTYDAYGNPQIHVVKVFDVSGPVGAYDGTVTAADANTVSAQIGNDPSMVGTILDINGDGAINAADVTLVSNNAGQAIATSPTSAINNPYLFTGRTLDILWKPSQGVNLITQDNRNRSYDPIHGRWLQRDPLEYIDSQNLYLYVDNSPLGHQDPFGQTEFADIAKGRLVYTCNCGWIDFRHAKGGPLIKGFWNTVLNESGEKSLLRLGFKASYTRGSGDFLGGPVVQGSQTAFVPYGLSLEQKKGVALDIFKKVSRMHERAQSSFLASLFTSSGFSEEDPTSDLISFYMAVEGYSKDFVISKEVCRALTPKQSEEVWRLHGGLGKNMTWQPKYHYSPCCPPADQGPKPLEIWSRYFETIQPNLSWSPWSAPIDFSDERTDTPASDKGRRQVPFE